MTNKQSLIFTCSFMATTSSLLGWLCVSWNLNWWLGIPIIIFIALLVEALERNRNDR